MLWEAILMAYATPLRVVWHPIITSVDTEAGRQYHFAAAPELGWVHEAAIRYDDEATGHPANGQWPEAVYEELL